MEFCADFLIWGPWSLIPGIFYHKDGNLSGFYVKKEVFDGFDNDLFVYEVYLEVLAAQAQFEVIFNRPWGSEKYVALRDLTNYLFIPINTVENLRN